MALGRAADPRRHVDAALTYAEVGATRRPELPGGYTHVERSTVVGRGREVFDRASASVLDWGAQRGSGLRVAATGPAGAVGTVVVLTVGLPRLGLEVPCRVVWVVDEPDRRGFGYGTLPGHPESGEESFVVTHDPASDEVTFAIRAFSRPATLLTRLGGPVARAAQSFASDRYLAAVRRAARG